MPQIEVVQVEQAAGEADVERSGRGVEPMHAVRHVAGQADQRPGGEQQHDVGRLDAHDASAEIGLEEAAAERALVRLDRLVGEDEAADGEEQVDAERRHLQMRFERRAAERVAITGEEARRPLQRMAEDDEGDGEETQTVDLRAVGALRDLALEPGRKSRRPGARAGAQFGHGLEHRHRSRAFLKGATMRGEALSAA